jgi:hypothetical protein
MNFRKYNSFNIEKIIQVLAYIQKRINCRNKKTPYMQKKIP